MSICNNITKMINRIYYKYKFFNSHRDMDTWVFGEWFGKKCNDSSLYLANYVAKSMPEISIVWIAKPECVGLEKLHDRIVVVEMDSEESIEILKTAGVVFVNEGLQDLSSNGFNYSYGGVIVNLWHGIPWKKIGMDTYRKNEVLSRIYARIVYSSQSFTLFPTSSDLSSQALISGFLTSKESLIKSGLPRNQLFYDDDALLAARKNIIEALAKKNNIVTANTRIIAYMPTFRDKEDSVFSFSCMESIERLDELLARYNAVIVQKAHIVNQNKNTDNGDRNKSRIITWNDCSAQELMASSDILITDYSSCFFDFLILNRPIIHYLYDYDYYANDDRGLYYAKEEVICGEAPQKEEELICSIERYLMNPSKDCDLRQKRREQFLTYEGSDCCSIIVDSVKKCIDRMNDIG